MMNKKLDFYFFGDIGEYDDYNPAFVCNRKYVPQILYLIAENEPFSISGSEIAKLLNIKEGAVKDVIDNFKLIDSIEIKNNTYRVKFPVFLEKDILKMESFINDVGRKISDKIIGMQDILYKKVSVLRCSKHYSYKRILYHIICDEIFDGTAFNFFTERNIFCASKLQPGGRNYIIVAYEDSNLVEKHSDQLLCSSNNYDSSGFTFNSFGDSNGIRKDVYRFFRLIQKSVDNASSFNKLNESYNKILDDMNKKTAYECGMLMYNIIKRNIKFDELSEKEKNLADFLNELEYVHINEADNIISVSVPVFYDSEISTVIKELSDIILTNIFPIVKEVFDNFEINASGLTSSRHGVNVKETANELWHQIFGAANEYLVKEGFVALPDSKNGQGRYLKSLIIS